MMIPGESEGRKGKKTISMGPGGIFLDIPHEYAIKR
jgi:hypothetical protein